MADLTAATDAALAAERSAAADVLAVVDSLIVERDHLLARVAELEAVPVVAAPMRLGACPERGGTSLAAALTVATKYGSPAVVRQFGGVFTTPRGDPRLALVHTSFAVNDMAGIVAGKYDARITDAARAARAGDVLTLKHEPEDEIARGAFTLAAYVAAWQRFHGLVKAANPQVRTCLTLMAWTFMAASHRNPADYANVPADLLGIDCDGITPKALPYPDWTEALTNAARWADLRSMGLCVPEYGAPRAPDDTTGAARAAAAIRDVHAFAAAGVEYVALFDYPTVPGYPFTMPAETLTWTALTHVTTTEARA